MTENKVFTATEVGTMLEDLKGQFQYVLEVVAPLPERMTRVENRLSSLEFEVRIIKDVIRIEIPDLKSRVSSLEEKC